MKLTHPSESEDLKRNITTALNNSSNVLYNTCRCAKSKKRATIFNYIVLPCVKGPACKDPNSPQFYVTRTVPILLSDVRSIAAYCWSNFILVRTGL